MLVRASHTWQPLAFAFIALVGGATAAQAGVTDALIGGSAAEVAEAAGPAPILPPSEAALGERNAEESGATATAWVRVDDLLRQRRGSDHLATLTAGNRGTELAWRLPGQRTAAWQIVEGWSTAEYERDDGITRLRGAATTERLAYGGIPSALGTSCLALTHVHGSLSGISTLVGDLFSEKGAGDVHLPYDYLEARASVNNGWGPWRWLLEIAASRVKADINLVKGEHRLALPVGQDGAGMQVRAWRRHGRALWACAAGATARSGRGPARYNGIDRGATQSQFGSQYAGVGWRRASGSREFSAEVAALQSHLDLQAVISAPAALSPVPGTKVRAQADARMQGALARVGVRQAVGTHTLVRAGLLHLRGSARFGTGYDAFGLWGLLPLASRSTGQDYPAFRLWVLGLGVEREMGGWRWALGAAQGFGQTASAQKKPAGGVATPGGHARTQGGRTFVLSLAKRW